MVYTLHPATLSDLSAIATIQRLAFNDPRNHDEIAHLMESDPLSSSKSDTERHSEAVEKLVPLLKDEDCEIIKAVEGEEKEGETVGFAIWLKPVLGGVKMKLDAREKEKVGEQGEEEAKAKSMVQRFSERTDRTRSRVMQTHPHWFLKLLCISPSHQRRGVGTLLLQYGLDASASNRNDIPGPFSVYLEASPAGVGAYERASFKKVGLDRLDEPRAQKGFVEWPYMVRAPPAPVCESGLHRGANSG